MTKQSGFKRRVRSRMARTGEAYSAARRHLDAEGQLEQPAAVLHLTNGDSAASGLRESGLRGPVVAWRDLLHDGPVPGGLAAAELRSVRARFLARLANQDESEVARSLAARDQALKAAASGEYVLWFEADLYDQLQLIQILHALTRLNVAPTQITLVSIGEHRGIAHFGGLGELTPAQLAELSTQGVQLQPDALELAVEAWRAFTSPHPDRLQSVARARSKELRFIGEAFARLMQEYPSRSDGLSLTERRILIAAAEKPSTAREVFTRVTDAERRPFLGDLPFFARLQGLAAGDHPLLRLDHRRLELTGAGESVLNGQKDQVKLNGVDRWIGGVHLTGAATWRYDDRLERLLQT